MDNILFIPGIANPVSEINQLLFGQGQQGGSWIPTLSSAMIAANTFGSGVTDILDLSGNNNPFSQATPSSRGAWFREPKRGRVNLLTQTDSLVGNGWGGSLGVTGTQVGTETKIENLLNSDGDVGWQRNVTVSPATVTFSVTVRGEGADIGKTVRIRLKRSGGTFVASDTDVLLTASPTRVSVSMTMLGDNTGVFCTIAEPNDGTGADVVFVSNPQLELGSTPTAYQRVTTAFDVTEAGQRDCYGARLDGIDDWHISGNIDLSSIDKATVFVAVRKRSDALRAQLLQFPDTGFNAFHMEAPGSTLNDYRGIQLGSATGRSADITQAAPDIAILTMQCDLGAPLVSLRRNGGAAVTSALSTGGGNFQNAALRIGSNGGSARFFNGDVFAIIMAGGSYPLSTIQRVERILSRITPTVNL
jgi:hypothetical protein